MTSRARVSILFAMAKQRILACPLCGETQYEQSVCKQCAARLDPDGLLLAEASFGPWYIRDEDLPFSPGMTYDILIRKVRDGVIENYTLLRGPTTRQLWKVANRVPGIAHLLGRCHACREHIDSNSRSCTSCGEAFGGYRDRNNLGLDKGDPPKVEVDGVSSFIGDTAIYDTTSEPIQLYSSDIDASDAPVTSAPEQNNDAPGTPAFRSLQRRLEGVQRIKRILIVALGVTGLGLLLALTKIF